MLIVVSESEDFLLVHVDGRLYNYHTDSSSAGGQPVPILLVRFVDNVLSFTICLSYRALCRKISWNYVNFATKSPNMAMVFILVSTD